MTSNVTPITRPAASTCPHVSGRSTDFLLYQAYTATMNDLATIAGWHGVT
jgi:hypothetical protein